MVLTIATLVGLHAAAYTTQSSTMLRWFSLGNEGTVPAWLSSIGLLAISSMLSLYAIWARSRLPGAGLTLRLASLAFLFFAVDEFAGVHELIGQRLDSAGFPFLQSNGGGWMIPYAVLGVVFVASCLKGVIRIALSERTLSFRFGAGLATWLVGGIGVEALMQLYLFRGPVQSAIEESCEMLGIAVMTWSLLDLCAKFSFELAFGESNRELRMATGD